MTTKPKILGIFCHPDDEILAGFPIFQNPNFERHLIITCSDLQRRGPNRRNALQAVCQQENITLHFCLDIDNNFYALSTRRRDVILSSVVMTIEIRILETIMRVEPDYIFTHNPVGEYGHGSHRLLFEIVSQHPSVKNLLITDLCQKSNHRSHDEIPRSVQEAYYRVLAEHAAINPIQADSELNMDFYNRCKAIYDKCGAWTWDFEPMTKCNLYILNEEL